MRFALRLLVAGLSGFAGVAAILLILEPGLIAGQKSWLLAAVTVMLVMTLLSTVLGVIGSACPSRSSRTMTMVRPAGPMFFCAPA